MVVLVDTSVWINHLRKAEPKLQAALEAGKVRLHPFVLGELALGTLADRTLRLTELSRMLEPVVATHEEVMEFIHQQRLFGRGVGYVDAALMTSARLTPQASVWTAYKRFAAVLTECGLNASETLDVTMK